MFAVIFEVTPKPGRREHYLREASLLRPELEKIDGFLVNERYDSLRRAGWMLSLSLWRNEKALIRWRTLALHHLAQEKGRFEIFADYHLRVGEIVADTILPASERLQEERFDETETGGAKYAVLSETPFEGMADTVAPGDIAARLGAPLKDDDAGPVAWDAFRHLLRPAEFLLLTSWWTKSDAESWLGPSAARGTRHRTVRIIRDYGMFDRREAPQYYPAVAKEATG
ncbi:MAG TPA: antibiotic biosynthesis monooxygenase [Xanthobacteraceae bacterium]|jgi:heme-degrading monooxygenase HmoA